MLTRLVDDHGMYLVILVVKIGGDVGFGVSGDVLLPTYGDNPKKI